MSISTETSQELLQSLDWSPDDAERIHIEEELVRRAHPPEFIRVCRVFAEHARYADDDFIAEIVAAAQRDVSTKETP